MFVKDHFEKLFAGEVQLLPADLERAEFIRDNIPKDVRTVLDVGCGAGLVTKVVAKEYEVTGLEFSSVGVEKVSKLGITCIQGSIAQLPLSDKSFDLVMASEVLEHLDEEAFSKGLPEVARVASKYIIVTVPNKERCQSLRQECPECHSICVPWTHIRSFNIDSVERLFSHLGFRCERAQFFGQSTVDYNRFITRLISCHRWFFNYLRPGMTCPVCKYSQRGPDNKGPTFNDLFVHPLRTGLHVFDFLTLKLSPKCPRWIFAVYRRHSV